MRILALFATTLIGLSAACSSDDRAPIEAGADPTNAPHAPTAADSPIKGVYLDPDDPAHLYVSVHCIAVPSPDAPPAIAVTETDQQAALELDVPILDPPCNPIQVELRLERPLADRQVVDSSGTTLPIDSHVPPDPAGLIPAACTDDAARASVAKDVDGGLRAEVIGCVDGWMAVKTSTDACPATDEEPAPGCIGNVHTAYWWDSNGHWTLVGFDDCEHIRKQYPGPPSSLCKPGS